MKAHAHPLSFFIVLGVTAICRLDAAKPELAASPIQKRIEALLQHRMRPEPLPLNPPNPFQMTSGTIRLTPPEEPPPVETAPVKAEPEPVVAESHEILADAASRLRVAGVIIQKNRLHVVLNGHPRTEGDSFNADGMNGLVHVKIVRLIPGEMTLKYADAEFALKF